jgi:hypothetical protein
MEEDNQKKLHNRLLSFERKYKEWEWSDVIRWLSSLKQVLDKIDPSTITEDSFLLVSKRLAQCLNPSLPQGLHTETLKIYTALLEKPSPPAHIFLLSSGLFPHFQICAPQNKVPFLSLMTQFFINQPNLELSMSGLIACLLSGAGEKQETLNSVFKVLDSIEDKAKVHFYVWNFVMKSSDFRNVGLMYMQKRAKTEYCEELVMNTLLESLEDSKVINKRLALDIIRNFFPIVQKTPTIVVLMQGVLKLFKGKDYTLTRRLWEWAFPEEINNTQVVLVREIITEALFLIFQENHMIIQKNNEKRLLTQIASLKIVEEVCMSEEIGEDFIKDISYIFLKHCIEDKLEEIPHNKLGIFLRTQSNYIWNSVVQVTEHGISLNENECLDHLLYSQRFLEFSSEFCAQICMTIGLNLHKVDHFSEFLSIIMHFIDKFSLPLDFSIQLKRIKKKLKQLVKYNKESALMDYIRLIIKVENDEKQLTKIVSFLKLLSGKNIILALKAILQFEQKTLTEDDFEALWTHVNANDLELLDLLLKSYEKFPEQWTTGFVSLLFSQSDESYIKIFITFWEYAAKINPELLLNISRGEKIVFIMIDLLVHDNPSIRHAAREWLNSAIKSPACLFDPILVIILHASTIRKVDESQNWFYIKNFDSSIALNSFSKATSLLLYSHNLLTYIQECKISTHSNQLMRDHNINAETYYELMVEVCFLYIKTESKFNSENFKVQCAATETLRMLIEKVPQQNVNRVMEQAGEILYKAIGRNLEYAMIPVVETLFAQKPRFYYPSKIADVMVLGLRHDYYYLRQQWSKIIVAALSSIFSSTFSDLLCNFIRLLFINYCDMILNHYDITTVKGLNSLTVHCLNLISTDKVKYAILKSMLFAESERVFILIINVKNSEEICKVLCEISKLFPLDLVLALVDLWQKNSEGHRSSLQLHVLIPKLGLSPESIFDGIHKAFESKKHNDVVLANLAYTVIEKMYQSIKYEQIWKPVLGVVKFLQESKWDECIAWAIKIIHILIGLICPSSKNLKSLQKILKGIIKKCHLNILKWEKIASSPLVNLEGTTLLEVIFNEIVYCHSLFRDVWKDNQKKLISIITSLGKTLLDQMCLAEAHAEILSKLLSTLLISFPTIFESLKSSLFETIKFSSFTILYKCPKSIEYWFDIINIIPKPVIFNSLEVYDALFFKSSDVKQKLLEKSLCIMSLAILSGPKDAYISFIPFILKRIEEAFRPENIPASALTILLIFLRILSYKCSNFLSIWQSILPELFSRLIFIFNSENLDLVYEALKLIDTLLVTFQEFSSYLWMFVYDYPEIEFEEGSSSGEYVPMLKRFLKGFRVRPKHGTKIDEFHGLPNKKIWLGEVKAAGVEEIEMYGKSIINYAMLYTTEILEADLGSVEMILRKEIIRMHEFLE